MSGTPENSNIVNSSEFLQMAEDLNKLYKLYEEKKRRFMEVDVQEGTYANAYAMFSDRCYTSLYKSDEMLESLREYVKKDLEEKP